MKKTFFCLTVLQNRTFLLHSTRKISLSLKLYLFEDFNVFCAYILFFINDKNIFKVFKKES